MKNYFYLILIFLLNVPPVYAANSLRLEVKPSTSKITAGEPFHVSTKLTNAGDQLFEFGLSVCPFEGDWMTDSKWVEILPKRLAGQGYEDFYCLNNQVFPVVLKPGGSLDRDLVLVAQRPAPKSPAVFRLGIHPIKRESVFKNSIKRFSKPVWSKNIALSIKQD